MSEGVSEAVQAHESLRMRGHLILASIQPETIVGSLLTIVTDLMER